MTKYTADNISKLEGLDAVRKLPGMYIGNNGTYGLHHLLQEIFSNSADEVMNGHGSLIRVTILTDGTAIVWDDGRGIPVDWKPETNMSAMTQVLTLLHAGGKFSGDSAYASSGGLHGIGAKAANAMSRSLVATVRRGGMIFRQTFHDGGLYDRGVVILNPNGGEVGEIASKTVIVTDKKGGITSIQEGNKKLPIKPDINIGTGTEIAFRPDSQWFDIEDWTNGDEVPWNLEKIHVRYRQFAFLNPGMVIELIDRRAGGKEKKEVFVSKKGLVDYIAWLNDGQTPLHSTIVFSGEDDNKEFSLEVAMQYVDDEDAAGIVSFVNGIPTPLGGTHVTGFQTGLTRIINKLSRSKATAKGDDLLLGLTAVVNLTMRKTPQFSSQTKESLTTSEAQGIVTSITYAELDRIFAKQKSLVNTIAKQAVAAAAAREAAKAARQLTIRRSVLDAPDEAGILSKLADTAKETPVEDRILFLVEGDSAGGSCKSARDKKTQAILAARGKIINAKKARLSNVLANKEIKAFVAAVGAGVGSEFDVSKMRYGKVAIFSDADVDGFHIRALWLTFIWMNMRPLITEGRLYAAEAPLYKVYSDKKEIYCYTEAEREKALKSIGESAKVQRYKGLGEMNPEQLRQTTLSPGNERLRQIVVEDVQEAAHSVNLLMGADSQSRKDWIMGTWDEDVAHS